MKAAILEQIHQPIQLRETALPALKDGQVLVKLHAAALNHRDVWIQQGLYPGIVTPIILGSDGAGVVEGVGEGVAEAWLGQEVILNPSHGWGAHTTHYGPDFKILGLPENGTFAEYICIDAQYVVTKPPHLSFEEAAALPLAGLTAWRALMSRSGLRAGERVLVTGAGGGVALFAVQFALAAGCEVWVTSGSDEKIEAAKRLGAKGGINYKAPNWQRDLLLMAKAPKTGYFDVLIDGAGGAGFARLVDVAAPGGRICFYGGTAGSITDLVPAKIFFKQLSLLGTTMGTEQEFTDMVKFVTEQQIVPVVDQVFELSEIEKALSRMQTGQQFGKIVVRIC